MPRNRVHLSLINPLKKFLNKNTEFQKYTVSLSVSLSLSDSPHNLSLSLTLTLLLRLRLRLCHSVSTSLSLSPSAKLLSSLLKLLDEEEALAVGVTSQSC